MLMSNCWLLLFDFDLLPAVGNITTADCFLFSPADYDDRRIFMDVNIYSSLF